MKHVPAIMMILLCTTAGAETQRELNAHEHGVGELNIAIDGATVGIELHAPGADIVGFEYAAETAEDRAAIDDAVAVLAKPMALFVLPDAAACSVVQASAGLELEDTHHDHEDHAEHDHEEHAEHDEHDHKEHAEHDAHDKHDHEEHAEHDAHDHDDHADEASHSEFHAAYTLNCAAPEAITAIDFVYFDTFENARELEVQIVSGSGAQAFEVTRDAPRLDLSSLF